MRQLVFTLVTIFALSLTSNAQFRVNGEDTILTPKEKEDVPADLEGIQYKKYLTKDYKAAFVDDFNEQAFLRYNIYDDQMEFVKGNQIYYLKKDIGRKVRFTDKTEYQVFKTAGELQFFLVHVDGENLLLSKQSIRYIDSEEPTSGYDRGRAADYRRKKDEFYLGKKGQGVIKLPTKKKKFLAAFGSKSSEIKIFMKKNRVGYKKAKDLKKIIAYYNTL